MILIVAVLAASGQRCSGSDANNPPPSSGEPPGGGSPPAQDTVLGVQSVATGLAQPLFVTAPVGDARLFIVEQVGDIRILADGVLRSSPFLNLRGQVRAGGEQGLLGLAFAPDYAASGLFYVNYTDVDGDTVIARYSVSADPNVADAGSREILLKIEQPFANHNGGMLAFGFDGYLYIGMGDGGSADDPGNRAQNDATLLGKMLRIDVSGGPGSGYAIPPTNPYAGGVLPLPEVWAKGLRNPFRFSFDRVMGDLYIGDVGQREREEVDVAPRDDAGGRNYGWRLMEGFACFIPASGCNDGSLTLPVHQYTHAGGRCSITGGYVYRGSIAAIFGHYFFADYCSDEVFSFVWDGGGGVAELTDRTAELAPPGGFRAITSFGEDGNGELYIVQFGTGATTGEVFRIVEMTASGPRRAPMARPATPCPDGRVGLPRASAPTGAQRAVRRC
ncbi:MAG: PQQ-dependent sugar dehydrogenase [Acidobacteriota bacterium]